MNQDNNQTGNQSITNQTVPTNTVISPVPTASTSAPSAPEPPVAPSAPSALEPPVQQVQTQSPSPAPAEPKVSEQPVNPEPKPVQTQVNPFENPTSPVHFPSNPGEVVIDTAKMPNTEIEERTPEEISVINTHKTKKSGKGFIILIILFAIFVYNIDNIVALYEKYFSSPSSIIKKDDSTNNLNHGYIQIDDNTSSDTINNIKFYNFAKKGNNIINYNYIATKNVSGVNGLQINIELYNSNKELLYKELFSISDNPDDLKKSIAKSASISLDNDIYSDSYYALIKIYTESEKQQSKSLTCKFTENGLVGSANYKVTYNFLNNELSSYSVTKQTSPADETNELFISLQSEYSSLPSQLSAKFSNGTLSYSVDFSSSIEGFNPMYAKGTVPSAVKKRELLKKWTCE